MWLTRSKSSQWTRCGAGRSLALAALAWMALRGTVAAETTTFDAIDAPIVRVNVRAGDVTIRTWERAAVSIDGDRGLVVERKAAHIPAEQIPLFIPGTHAGPDGSGAQLPAESFVVSSIPYGPREQIVIKTPPGFQAGGGPQAPLTVTVPADAVFISARTGGGNLDVHDYRAGTFVGFVARGRLALHGAGGTAFVQTGRGPLRISDSSFERLRARSLSGNMTFERCRVRQIEATTVNGSIVYDGGSFEPGLARFESRGGDIAVGTSEAAQIGAHTAGAGRVFTNFEHGARVDGQTGTANALVAGGGPVVTVTSQTGNVYLYDGSLRNRARMLPSPWLAPLATLQRPAGVRPALGGRFAPRRPRPRGQQRL